MSDDGSGTEPVQEQVKRARSKRAEDVRKKYDFSVIRALRQKRGLTIEKFAKLCGLSYAPISRIETNLIKPNLETLDKIADGLGITTYNLVAMAEKRDAEQSSSRETQAGGFSFRTVTFNDMDISYGKAERGAEADRFDVQSRDFENIIVQTGVLEVTVNDKEFRIAAGQALRFDSVFPHRYVAVEDTELVVISHSSG